MAEPIPDFTQDERHAVPRTPPEHCMPVRPAHQWAINLLTDRLSAVAGDGKRAVRI